MVRVASLAVVVAVVLFSGVGAEAAKVRLITISIAGNGRVMLNSGESLACNGSCDATLRPSSATVVMNARPGVGSRFMNWTGACLGTRPVCTIPTGHAAHVNAFFAQAASTVKPTPVSNVTVVAGKPSEFAFTLSSSTVRLGTVTFNVTNAGMVPHDFFVCSVPGEGIANVCAGTGTAVNGTALIVTFTAPGTYEYLCTIAGHAAAGMKGLLTVVG